MNYKFAKIIIISLLFFLSSVGLVFADESCSVLYNKQSDLINKYDTNQNKKLSLEESYQAVSAWNNYTISEAVLLDILKFSRQNCVIPSVKNDPVSGTLSVSATQVNVGETIVLTVTGKDNDGLQNLWAYYQGSWHNKPTQGTTSSSTFSFSESKPGTYTYKGYVYGSQPTGIRETTWTTPQTVTVIVVEQASTIINCQQEYGEEYWCANYNVWQKECSSQGKINSLLSGKKCQLSDGGDAYYCATCSGDVRDDPVSGTLSASSTTVRPGDNITLTLTGQDDNGLHALLVYYKGAWHSELVQGTAASKTFSFSETQAGIYTYFGYVYGKKSNGSLEFNWTEPKMVTVTVSSAQVEGSDLIISSISTSPNSVTTADEVDFKITIKNIGTQQMSAVSGGIITKVSSDSMEGSGWRICDAMITQLKAGESIIIDCPIMQKFSEGSYNFTFLIDSDNRLVESNEINNSFLKTITVVSGSNSQNDPVSGTFSISATSIGIEKSFTLTVDAQDNQGVDRIEMYYNNEWHKFDCDRQVSCLKSYQLSESIAGVYDYYAKVYGFKIDGTSEEGDVYPSSIQVTVKKIGNCTDTDGGKDYYIKGTITNTITAGGTSLGTWTDICLKDNQVALAGQENYLFEGYCDDDGIGRLMSGPTVFHCVKGCKDGACIK